MKTLFAFFAAVVLSLSSLVAPVSAQSVKKGQGVAPVVTPAQIVKPDDTAALRSEVAALKAQVQQVQQAQAKPPASGKTLFDYLSLLVTPLLQGGALLLVASKYTKRVEQAKIDSQDAIETRRLNFQKDIELQRMEFQKDADIQKQRMELSKTLYLERIAVVKDIMAKLVDICGELSKFLTREGYSNAAILEKSKNVITAVNTSKWLLNQDFYDAVIFAIRLMCAYCEEGGNREDRRNDTELVDSMLGTVARLASEMMQHDNLNRLMNEKE